MGNPLNSCSPLRHRRRIKRKIKDSPIDESLIPDELIIDILGRLPAKDLLRSRCVCRRWRELTSTRDFTDLQLRRSGPMLLKKDRNGAALLDRCWEPTQTRSKIHKVYQPFLTGIRLSQNGLIIAHPVHDNFIIYNPIYRDLVNIISPIKAHWSEVLGIYFHPEHEEYCTLWRVTVSYKPWKVQYKILNLESNPYWRDIKNPCTQNNTISLISPVFIDKYLYWMVEPSQDFCITYTRDSTLHFNIMEFDVRNEEFRMMPSPVPVICGRNTYNVNLIDIDGVVSLVQVLPSKVLSGINIWTLKNDEEPLWRCSNYAISSNVYPEYGLPVPIAFRNGELVLQSNGRLYVCNLKSGTFKKFGSRHHCRPHLVSLVSLRNWKSKTYMVEDDEHNHRDKCCGEEVQTSKKP